MPPFAPQRILAGLIAVLVATSGGELLRAQGPSFGRARTILPPDSNPKGAGHFGVMGAIAEPGVYALDGQSPLLVDVVRAAGGLTDDATGNVRIVRNGRSGQQTFYTPNLDYRLAAGDLLVVDRFPPHRSRVRVDGDGANRDDGSVQLAFLGLVDRPVVLRMRRETASIARILRFLEQSPEIARSIRVIETGPHYTRGERTVDTQLAHGSVLIFDDARIDVGRLPEFPALKGNEESTPRPLPEESPALTRAPSIGRPDRDVAGLPRRTAEIGVPASNASLSTNPFANPPLPRDIDEPAERPLLGGPSFSASSAATPDPGLDGPSIGPEVAAAPGVVDPGFLDGTPDGADLEKDDENAAIPPIPGEGDGPSAERADNGSLYIVLGVLALAAGLIWFLGRRPNPVATLEETPYAEPVPAESTPITIVRDDVDLDAPKSIEPRRTEPIPRRTIAAESKPVVEETPEHYIEPYTGFGSVEIVGADSLPSFDLPAEEPVTEPVVDVSRTWFRFDDGHERSQPSHTPAMGRSHLDALIEGEVPLAEEPVELPASMELFGRPSTERRYRVDASEEPGRAKPRRPHFIARSHEATRGEAAVTSNDTAEEDGEQRVRMLDRALNAVHGANRR